MADECVVWREEAVVVDGCACKNCFVFGAVGYILDDLFDVGIVADVLVTKCVKSLFECSVLVVFVVGDVVEPGCGDGVEHEVVVVAAVLEVLLNQV